ncbi:hypothetical protein V6Z11_D04G058700 [Gossypium hirsutum]
MILYNVARLSIVYTVDDDHISILEQKIAVFWLTLPWLSLLVLSSTCPMKIVVMIISFPLLALPNSSLVLTKFLWRMNDGSHVGEKKKRLKLEQVKALEKSFESGNKLEPQRKLQLAKALGLKPRQIAIWFQNRRVRWKTKQLEKDYDVLKKQCEALKADADALQAQNNKLSAELLSLKTKDTNEISIKDEVNEGSWSSKNLFSTSSTRPTSMVQLLQGSTRSNLPCTKPDQVVQEEGFCHLLNEVDEQQGFWPWGEQ